MYRDAGTTATFRLYPGVGHDVTAAMDSDIIDFFAAALASRQRLAP